jgi:hypothetical protein
MKRKPISKKLRFEVLKRDAFTCQYCGEKAPDVILHVDHIKSVVTGGDGEIINLITACSTCNLGKGPHNLSDKSAVNKQRKQLDDINERRNQLELMVKWRNEIAAIKNDELKAIIEAIPMETNSTLTETGRTKAKRWLKKYPLEKILEVIDISFDQYLRYNKDGFMKQETWEKAFNMVQRILDIRGRPGYTEESSRINYVSAILYNRGTAPNKYYYKELLEKIVELKIDIEEIAQFAKTSDDQDKFEDYLNILIEKRYGELEGGAAFQ